jgi:flagellar hook protein FlgE
MGTTSFYAAITGMAANRQAIDVIGNNLANLNTVGYKKSFVTFSDIFSASMATSVNGAGNPMESGLGVKVASIDQVFSQGSIRNTGSATDMAIQGAGFFILQGNDGYAYSRAGKFSFSKDGDLVAPNGKFVLGYGADDQGNIITSSEPSAINVSAQTNSSPQQTSNIFINTLLDADAMGDSLMGEFSSPVRTFDSLGVPHTLNYIFRRLDPPANGGAVEWGFDIRMDAAEVYDAGGNPMGITGEEFSVLKGGLVGANDSIATGDFDGLLLFDANGVLQEVDFSGTTAQAGLGAFNVATPDVDPNGIQIPGNGANFTMASGATNLDLEWDVFNEDGSSNIVSFASDSGSATSSVSQDGYGVGTLNSIIVDPDGTITGLFTNGDVRDLAQLAMANFNNPQGLIAAGDNEFRQTPGSGLPSRGVPENGGRGSISGSSLELSNVDLAEEFTNLIISERGFQANSRVITTNDKLLQEAVNLVR